MAQPRFEDDPDAFAAFWDRWFRKNRPEWYAAAIEDWLVKAEARSIAMTPERAALEIAVMFATRHELFYKALHQGETELNAEGIADRDAPAAAARKLQVHDAARGISVQPFTGAAHTPNPQRVEKA